jgi:hypothetical protein
MTKEAIMHQAEIRGLKLDYDKSDGIGKDGRAEHLRYIRFVSKDENLDEPDLRWIWYMDDPDDENLKRGDYVVSRLTKKQEVINQNKY